MLAALVRPVFGAADRDAAREQLSEAVATLEGRLPKVAAMLEAAEEDVLAFYAFPAAHRRKIRSTNPLERLNREIGRRTDVVGIFPNDRALVRLATCAAIEQNDEWLVGRRYLSAGSMEPLLEESAPSPRGRGGEGASGGLRGRRPYRRSPTPRAGT